MSTFQDVDNLMQQILAKRGPAGCCIAVTRGEETIYEKYYGYADVAETKPLSPEHVFRQYSMTKPLAALCGLIRLERGVFLLDDPISDYLPEYKHMQVQVMGEDGKWELQESKTPITLRHAFSMGVGMLAHDGSPTDTYNQEIHEKLGGKKLCNKYDHLTEVRALAGVPMLWEPGTHWQYGVGLELMGAVVEATSGMTLGQFMKKNIFEPLGMNETGYHFMGDMKARMVESAVTNREGQRVPLMGDFLEDRLTEPDGVYECASTGVISTLRDYTKFAKMLANGGELGGVRIVGRKSLDLMRRNQLTGRQLSDYHDFCVNSQGYGYGLGVRTMMDPAAGGSNGSIGEYGWAGLLGTWLSVDPEEKTSIVYMHHTFPNLEDYAHMRIRSVVNGLL